MAECNSFAQSHIGLYNMHANDWEGRDYGQCGDVGSEFAKHFMAGQFLRSGIILDPATEQSPFYFHHTVFDWAALSFAVRSNFHTQLRHIPDDVIGPASAGTIAQWTPSIGDDAIRTSCALYTFQSASMFPAATPEVRAAQFVHEAMHATLASQGFDEQHIKDQSGPNCPAGNDCDQFTLHAQGIYPPGELAVQKWESRDGHPPFAGEFTGHVEHKAYQAEMEYECDVANAELVVGSTGLTAGGTVLTTGMALNARGWANARLMNRFVGTVPSIACGCTTSMCAGVAGPVATSGGLHRVSVHLEGQMYESCGFGINCDNLTNVRLAMGVRVGPSKRIDDPQGLKSGCLGGEVFFTMDIKGEFFTIGEARPDGSGNTNGDEVWVFVNIRFHEEDGADNCRTGDCEEDLNGYDCPGPGVWIGPMSPTSPSTWARVIPIDLDNRGNEGGDDWLKGTLTIRYGW
jgi:hypothetical protein